MPVRMPGLAFGGGAEHRGHIVIAFHVGLLREIQVAAIRLRFTGERVLQVAVGLAAFELHALLLVVEHSITRATIRPAARSIKLEAELYSSLSAGEYISVSSISGSIGLMA